MTQNRGILATVLLLFLPSLPSALEKPKAEGLLAWFPSGVHAQVFFTTEYDAKLAASTREAAEEMLGKSDVAKTNPQIWQGR